MTTRHEIRDGRCMIDTVATIDDHIAVHDSCVGDAIYMNITRGGYGHVTELVFTAQEAEELVACLQSRLRYIH